MKRTKEMQPDCYYLFEGKSAANTVFIENLKEAKQFCIYANYFLKGYLKVYEYMINQDGWVIIVKLCSESKIRSITNSETEIWRIVSERIRLLLSTYVRVTNRWEGREGVKVKHGYRRYYFENLGEAKSYIKLIRNQQVKLYQKKRKYRGLKTHRAIPIRLGKGHIFLCSKWVRRGKKRVERKRCICEGSNGIIEFKDLVVQKMINSPLNHHSASFPFPKRE